MIGDILSAQLRKYLENNALGALERVNFYEQHGTKSFEYPAALFFQFIFGRLRRLLKFFALLLKLLVNARNIFLRK